MPDELSATGKHLPTHSKKADPTSAFFYVSSESRCVLQSQGVHVQYLCCSRAKVDAASGQNVISRETRAFVRRTGLKMSFFQMCRARDHAKL